MRGRSIYHRRFEPAARIDLTASLVTAPVLLLEHESSVAPQCPPNAPNEPRRVDKMARNARRVSSIRMLDVPLVILESFAKANDFVLRVANRSIKGNGVGVVAANLQIDLWTA